MESATETTSIDTLFDDLDRASPVPLYFQVSKRLESAIRSGHLAAGAKLENEVSLGERLGISRPTIRRAIQELVDKGLLVRRRGVGTQVVQGPVTRQVEFTSLFDDLRTSHQNPSTRVLTFERVEAPSAFAEHLGVRQGSLVHHIRRVRLASEVPVAILENYLPITAIDLNREALTTSGLYAQLQAKGVTMRVAKQRIGARLATPEETELLSVDVGSPVLTMQRTAYDSAGAAVEYGTHCYRTDYYSFETTLVNR
ncbi:GntR family transcriptional regulator [Lysinibacter cavernae]|uniref:DNA-binding GntR family transcriptional regulator n=1 Tax=Lysinibacter cavernae TaxID=1640652 RepID=A0A7X5QYI8_9MICO|nr:DNA-binding GntR family transcriptional regulator [Lysinibacter cavernae]